MCADSRLIPEAMIGGIVGGVLFLLVAVLLTTMAIIHSRRKDSKARNAANYGMVFFQNSLLSVGINRVAVN